MLLQHFGPVNVATWGVNVAVELERGPAAAESLHADAPRLLDAFGSAVRGGALYFDLARAYAQAEGDRDREAIQCLDTADRLAPQYVRPDPMARDLVLTLDRRARRRVWERTACVTASVSAPRVHGVWTTSVDLARIVCRVSAAECQPETQRAGNNRKVIHATCTLHSGPAGFANLVVSKRDGTIVFDPHVTGACVLTLAEDEPSPFATR